MLFDGDPNTGLILTSSALIFSFKNLNLSYDCFDFFVGELGRVSVLTQFEVLTCRIAFKGLLCF